MQRRNAFSRDETESERFQIHTLASPSPGCGGRPELALSYLQVWVLPISVSLSGGAASSGSAVCLSLHFRGGECEARAPWAFPWVLFYDYGEFRLQPPQTSRPRRKSQDRERAGRAAQGLGGSVPTAWAALRDPPPITRRP